MIILPPRINTSTTLASAPKTAPVRFGSIAHIQSLTADNKPGHEGAKAFAAIIQDAFEKVSLAGNKNTIWNRVVSFTLLMNVPDCITIQTKSNKIVMFNGPECKLMSAVMHAYEDTFLPAIERGDVSRQVVADALNEFVSSAIAPGVNLDLFEGDPVPPKKKPKPRRKKA